MTALNGQVALVTGGARGIGRGIALALAQAGADAAVADLEHLSSTAQQYSTAAIGGFTAARQTAAEITALGRRSLAIQADVRQKEDAARMVEETLGRLGALHVLVCNAGVGFTNSLAKELAPSNIRVNAICPGILRTQVWEYLAETLKRPDESKEDAWRCYVKGLIPLGRPQTPEDIGQLAVYLATAENVTGQAINVDGGVEWH